MIRSYNIDTSIAHGCTKGFPIRFFFDGRIPFDPVAKSAVVGIAEPQMVYTDFRRDSLLCCGYIVAEETQFFLCR
ncbi:hypothetical protein MTY414_79020 [Mycolicibacterium mageritense]|nr:hypothetical protein MTY414_79020 [Mycolicibacterium mageritense]